MSDEARPRSKMLALKERRGPVPEELLDSVRQNNAARTAIKRALADGPHTVPEIAEATGLPDPTVLWTITAMRKYGAVLEDSVDGSYPRYALTAKDPRS
jgi:DNA-binding transcriptional ArsR family regulator